jgi:hypothetical protein
VSETYIEIQSWVVKAVEKVRIGSCLDTWLDDIVITLLALALALPVLISFLVTEILMGMWSEVWSSSYVK